MKKLSDVEKKASSKVLSDLRSHAQSMMNNKMKGLKKVTVASDSKEGLKAGLEKAEEILGSKGSASDLTKSPKGEVFGKSKSEELDEENPEEIEGLESDESEVEEEDSEEMSEEELDAKIKELMSLKSKLQNK